MSNTSVSIENSYRSCSVGLVVQTQRHATALHSGFVWLEMLLVLSTLTLILQLFWLVITEWNSRPRAGTQVVAHFSGKQGSLSYWIYLPSDYCREGKFFPVLLYLHGAGSRGSDLSLVKRSGPPADAERQGLPFVVVSPQCPGNSRWQPSLLLELLDAIEQRFHVDSDRMYLTGCSMGGVGVWSLAVEAPQRFAAIAPICGGGDAEWAEQLVELPTWAFHSRNDEVVPFGRSEELVEAIRTRNGKIKFTAYPELGHDICDYTFQNTKLYAWLLKQKR